MPVGASSRNPDTAIVQPLHLLEAFPARSERGPVYRGFGFERRTRDHACCASCNIVLHIIHFGILIGKSQLSATRPGVVRTLFQGCLCRTVKLVKRAKSRPVMTNPSEAGKWLIRIRNIQTFLQRPTSTSWTQSHTTRTSRKCGLGPPFWRPLVSLKKSMFHSMIAPVGIFLGSMICRSYFGMWTSVPMAILLLGARLGCVTGRIQNTAPKIEDGLLKPTAGRALDEIREAHAECQRIPF